MWQHCYGRNAVYPHGDHGNALLSRFPIRYYANHDISLQGHEARGLLHCILELPGEPAGLHAICVHLGLRESHRRQQLKLLRALIEEHVPDGAPLVVAASVFGSIYPAVWSFQLALRSRGLGSTFTTLHLLFEQEARALLGIPADVMQVALLPVAWTRGGDFRPAARPPVETIVHWNRWDAAR